MNNSAPLIKKRQLMRLTFGDYRAKMVEEERKFNRSKYLDKQKVLSNLRINILLIYVFS